MKAKWVEIRESQLPKGIRFDYEHRADAGQMVDVQFGFFGRSGPGPDAEFQKVVDRSVGPTPRYYRRIKDE